MLQKYILERRASVLDMTSSPNLIVLVWSGSNDYNTFLDWSLLARVTYLNITTNWIELTQGYRVYLKQSFSKCFES